MLVQEFTITPIHGTNEYSCCALSYDAEDWYETSDYANALTQMGEVSEADDLDKGLVRYAPENIEYKKITMSDGFCYYVGYIIH